MKRPKIFIISGPSGAGEDSVIKGLYEFLPIEKIVTTTTRKMREDDIEGISYYFISREEFEKNIAENKMAEWAEEYNGNLYGVTRNEFERVANSEKIGIWKIEYKGVIFAKKNFPEIKSIYIAPPSLEVSLKRIAKRNENVDKKYLEERMNYTKEWMKHEDIYDYKVINEEGKLEKTITKVVDIIKKNVESD